MNKTLKIGVATVAQQRARTMAIASGKQKRAAADPTIWFPSISAMARIISDENLALLKVIREQHPDSIEALAEAVGRHAPNVSRSLHAMVPFELVTLVKKGRSVIPETAWEHLTVKI
jgi:predicted transcriptional regulator